MAPEIIMKAGYGPAVDVYACGVVLYTILTGRLPYSGRNLTDYFRNVVMGDIKFPPMLWRGISPTAKLFVRALLQREPEKRLTSLAALKHDWMEEKASHNLIKRDRSGLHHSDRKLLKPKAAFFAVSVVHKVKRLHELRYGLAKIPEAIDVVERKAKKTVVYVEKGAKKTTRVVEKGAKRTGRGAKKVGKGIGRSVRRGGGHHSKHKRDGESHHRRRKRRRRRGKKRRKEPEMGDIAAGLKSSVTDPDNATGAENDDDDDDMDDVDEADVVEEREPTSSSFEDSMHEDNSAVQLKPSGTTTRTQSTDSFITAATSFRLLRSNDPERQQRAAQHAIEGRKIPGERTETRTTEITTIFQRAMQEKREPVINDREVNDVLNPPNITLGEDLFIDPNRRPAGLARLLEKAKEEQKNEVSSTRAMT